MTAIKPTQKAYVFSADAGEATGVKAVQATAKANEAGFAFRINAEDTTQSDGYRTITDYAQTSFTVTDDSARRIVKAMKVANEQKKPYCNITVMPEGKEKVTYAIPANSFDAIIEECKAPVVASMSWTADRGIIHKFGNFGTPAPVCG